MDKLTALSVKQVKPKEKPYRNRTKHLKRRHEMMKTWVDYLGKLKVQVMGIRLGANSI